MTDQVLTGANFVGEWEHLAVTYDVSDRRATLYRNGEALISTVLGGSDPIAAGDLYIGYDPVEQDRMDGFIDEPSIYNVLGSAEIYAIYANGSHGKHPVQPNTIPQVETRDPVDYFRSSTTLRGTVVDDGLPITAALQSTWSSFALPDGVSPPLIANAGCRTPRRSLVIRGVYTLQLLAEDGYGLVTEATTVYVDEQGQCADIDMTDAIIWLRGELDTEDATGTVLAQANGGLDYVDGQIGAAFDTTKTSNAGIVIDAPVVDLAGGSFSIELWQRRTGARRPLHLMWSDGIGRGTELSILSSGRFYYFRARSALNDSATDARPQSSLRMTRAGST